MLNRRIRKISDPGRLTGPSVSTMNAGKRTSGGKVRIAALAGFSSVALVGGVGAASLPATAQTAAERTAPAAPGGEWSCDETGFDWHTAEIAPDNTQWNPRSKRTTTQMEQKHVLREDTRTTATTQRKGTYLYIEDKKSGQKCRSKTSTAPEGTTAGLRSGYLDNRNTSIMTCLVEPGHNGGKPDCGDWNREDSGGHRQWDFDGLEILDKDTDPGATASYAKHETPWRGESLGKKYGVKYGDTSYGRIMVQGEHGASYARLRTKDKSGKVRVRLDSDKYGKGEWVYATEGTTNYRFASTGVLYNDDDRLRVVVDGPNGKPVYGRWRNGKNVDG